MRFLSVLLYFALSSYTVLGQWIQTSGPTGAQSDEIFYVGNYLVANSVHGGIFRSSDKGVTWEDVNNGLPSAFRCNALDIDNTNLYIATSHGVYYSSSLGDSWELISAPNVVGFSIEASGNEIFVGFHGGLIYYSPDHGNTWQSMHTNPFVETISQIRKFGNELWIGTDRRNLFLSPDGGESWLKPDLALVVSGIHVSDSDLFVSGNDRNGVFVICRSSDRGFTWTVILYTAETNVASSGFVKEGNEIFISGATHSYYSADNGMTWVSYLLPSDFAFYSMSSMASVDDGLIISYSDGILYSDDKGATWHRRNTGYRNHVVNKLARTEDAIVSISETNGAFVSADSGSRWKQIHDPALGYPYPLPLNIYAHDSNIVMSYVHYVYRSTDTGRTWQKILTPDVTGLDAIPALHLAGFEESLVVTAYKGVHLSRNMGGDWDFVPKSAFGPYELLKSYVQHDTVIVLTQEDIFLSTNFGATWQKKTVPDLPVLNWIISDIIVDKSMMIMSTNAGMYKSPDLGLSWKKMQYVPDELIYDMEKVGDKLILATYTGIFVSGTNGIGWYAVSDGLEGNVPLTILVSDSFSYVGTKGQSVWRIPTSELLTTGEFINVGGESVPMPLVDVECSTLTITNATNDVQIRWYKEGTLIPNQSDKTLQSTGAGAYAASFENETDIKISSVVNVKEPDKSSVSLYNIITVNGDGKNDRYIVDEELTGSKLQVINRWGEIVYSSDSYDNDWFPDQISTGQYFYLIESMCLGRFKGVLTVVK